MSRRIRSYPELLILLALCAGCRRHAGVDPLLVPIARGYDASTVMTNRTGFLSPFLCAAGATRLACQATMDVVLRRGTQMQSIPRGSTMWWDNPKGTGDGIVWYGCPTDAECTPQFHFVSDAVTTTPGDGVVAMKGDGMRVPPGNIGIVAAVAQNNEFIAVHDRWSGSWAPPLLVAGQGTELHCTDAQCRIVVPAPPAAPASRTSISITGPTAIAADAGTTIECGADGKCIVGEVSARRR